MFGLISHRRLLAQMGRLGFCCYFGLAVSIAIATDTQPDTSIVVTASKTSLSVQRPAQTAVATDQEIPPYKKGELIVKFKDSVSLSVHRLVKDKLSFRNYTQDGSDSLDKLARRHGLRDAKPIFRDLAEETITGSDVVNLKAESNRVNARARHPARAARVPVGYVSPTLYHVYLLTVDKNTNIQQAIADYAADAHVEYASPNYNVKVHATANDPYYNAFGPVGAWGQNYPDLWGLHIISAGTAWDTSLGTGVIVAVVDTGVDYNHPDLAANIVPGWDLSGAGDSDPMDYYGHGTHAAGTIAAVRNNNLGIVGVAPNAKIMPVKGFYDNGAGSTNDLAEAIRYAADQGADVINNSWGCQTPCPSNPTAEDAVRYAYGKGSVVVFSAGNDYGLDVHGTSPQNMPEVITVSATTYDPYDGLASYSNYGVDLDLAAPGGGATDILSLKSTNLSSSFSPYIVGTNYLRLQGTSMAAPHVSGLAALILGQYPTFTVEQVRQAIRHGSDDLFAVGFDTKAGYGRINAVKALAESNPPQVLITTNLAPVLTANIPIYGMANGGGTSSWILDYGTGSAPTSYTTLATGSTTANALIATLPVNNMPDGDYTLRLRATATGGTYEDRAKVVINRIAITAPSALNPIVVKGGSIVTISGSAAQGALLASYTIKVTNESGALMSNVSVTNGGGQPVVNGVLGTWNTSGAAAGYYTITLELTTTMGTVLRKTTLIGVDPSLHTGWPIRTYENYDSKTNSPILADMDQDGKSEILLASSTYLHIYKENGTELSGWPKAIYTTTTPVVGDLSGDQIPDVISANSAQAFAWDKNGQNLPGWPITLAGSDKWHGVALADVDGDSSLDVVVTATSGASWIGVYKRDGSSLPGWPKQIVPGASSNSIVLSRPAVGDLEGLYGDGKKEIAISALGPDGMLRLYVFGYDGQLLPGWPKDLFRNGATNTSWTFTQSGEPALAELSGHRLQIIVQGAEGPAGAYGYPGVTWAFHRDGSLVAGWPITTEGSGQGSVVAGDLTGDGLAEIVVPTYIFQNGSGGANTLASKLYVLRGDGTNLSGWPVTYQPEGANFDMAALSDLSGDGLADVVSYHGPRDYVKWIVNPYLRYRLSAYQGLTGQAVAGFPKVTIEASTMYPPGASPAIGDIDGDGQAEVVQLGIGYDGSNFYTIIYAWDVNVPAQTKAPWPMYRGGTKGQGHSDSDEEAPVTTASPVGGGYGTAQLVTLTCNDGTGSGCSRIYYTTNGTTPTTASSVYTTRLSIAATTTLNYFAVDLVGNAEAVKTQSYIIDSSIPTITSFSPTAGTNQTWITITGTNLKYVTSVTFNGQPAYAYQATSNTEIRAMAPIGVTTGKIAVTNAAGTATSSQNFNAVQPPTITSFNPTAGTNQTWITITGTNLKYVTSVTFNGQPAYAYQASSTTEMLAMTPIGVTTGKIVVRNAAGTAVSVQDFIAQ